MKSEDIISIDVFPRLIQACETYTSFIKLSLNPDIQLRSALGEVSIEVPFDGETCFPMSVAEKLRELGHSQTEQARIGFLAVSSPLDTQGDWGNQLQGTQIEPVFLPLNLREQVSTDDWTRDDRYAFIQHRYQPEAPVYEPLQLKMWISDGAEQYQRDLNRDWLLDTWKDLQGKKPQEVLDALTIDPLQGGQVVIDLLATANLPNVLLADEEKRDQSVKLSELRIKWPSTATSDQITINCLIKEENGQRYHQQAWRFDPDQAMIILRDLPTIPGLPKKGSPVRPYYALLQLILHVPGKVVAEDILSGSLQMRVEGCLLSGRQLSWLDATGMRSFSSHAANRKNVSQAITSATVLQADFSATLRDHFNQRRTSVYRQWHFHGLQLQPNRMDDLAAALRDLGYQVQPGDFNIPIEKDAEQGSQAPYSIAAVCGKREVLLEGVQPVRLEIQLWAYRTAPARTLRERDLDQEGKVSTELGTTDVTIQVRGAMEGPGSHLALDIDRLMTNLKNRFSPIADLR